MAHGKPGDRPDNRQRGPAVRSLARPWSASPRQRGAQADDTIMCQSTGCSGPLPLLPRLDRVLQMGLT
jgi:hypothetical protein